MKKQADAIIYNRKMSTIYCRVSTKDQEDTGYSLPSQQRLLLGYSDRKDLPIDREFLVSESASGSKQRRVFAEMMKYMEKNKIKDLIVEKVDRLTRNFREAVVVDDWLKADPERNVHFVKNNLILHANSKSDDKFRWDMEIVLAKKYIANLSEESKKGIKEKLEQGYYHGAYKAGYKCVGEKGKRIHIPDTDTFELWKNLGALYMTGEYTMSKIVKEAWNLGLRSRYGKKIYKSQVESFLKDPFYHGHLVHKGEVVNTNGKHERMRTQEEYDLIQEIRIRRKSPFYSKHTFLFSKMIECGECGGTITSEIQKSKIYCHCTHYRGCTQKKYTRQDKVEAQLTDAMRVFETITDSEAADIVRKIRANHEEEVIYKKQVLNNLEGSYRGIQNKIDRLYDDRLSDIISDNFWKSKNEKLVIEQKDIVGQLEKLKSQEAEYFEIGLNILELARKSRRIYSKRSDEEKRMILRTMFKKIELTDGKITYELIEPVRLLEERLNSVKNIFEPKKPLQKGLSRTLQSKTAAMLPR